MPKIEDIIVELITNGGTFYASLVSQMHKVSDNGPDNPTLYVTIKNGRVHMHYNPDFLNGLTMKEAKAVVEHECLHIVMEHHFRAKDKTMQLWGVATDVAINQMIRNLPKDCLTIKNTFSNDPNIYADETADYYYDKLKQDMEQQGAQMHGCGEKFECENNGAEGVGTELAKEIIKQMVGEAVKENEKAHGTMPSQLQHLVDELLKPPKISWRTILKQFISNSIKAGSKASWKRPNRRYGGVQKGRISDRVISLVVAIDTSGSVSDGMLAQFMSEITAIQSCYKSVITVIECDAEVHRSYKMKKYDKVDKNVQGRGGTAFEPVFDYIKANNIRTDALIYFTDLCGSFPDKKPRYPTLWAYYDGGWGGKGGAPFGKVLELEKEKANE